MRFLICSSSIRIIACSLVLHLLPAAAQQPTSSQVELRYHGLRKLETEDSRRLEAKAVEILRSSEFNSSAPMWAWDESAIEKQYRQALEGDHFIVTYTPELEMSTGGGKVSVKMLVIGLLGTQYASSLHTVDGSGRIVGHAKYSGDLCIQMLNLVKSLPNTSLERTRDR
jgi:hypothetical protein